MQEQTKKTLSDHDSEAPRKQINYKHLFDYDQSCFDGIEYGLTKLYYAIEGDTLYLKKIDSYLKNEIEIEFPISFKNTPERDVIQNFITDLFSYRSNFAGQPFDFSSEIFSVEELNLMLKKGEENIIEKRNEAVRIASENELINYCKLKNLMPEPTGDNVNNWQANCPSGRGHHIMISTTSNEWGCGYCRKKGKLIDLVKWIENKN